MGGVDDKMDEAKGRMKEASGDMIDDDQLKKEGKADRLGATAKEKAGEAVDKAKEMLDQDR